MRRCLLSCPQTPPRSHTPQTPQAGAGGVVAGGGGGGGQQMLVPGPMVPMGPAAMAGAGQGSGPGISLLPLVHYVQVDMLFLHRQPLIFDPISISSTPFKRNLAVCVCLSFQLSSRSIGFLCVCVCVFIVCLLFFYTH